MHDYTDIAMDMSEAERLQRVKELTAEARRTLRKADQFATPVGEDNRVNSEIETVLDALSDAQSVVASHLQEHAEMHSVHDGQVVCFLSPGMKTGPQDALIHVDIDTVEQEIRFKVSFEEDGGGMKKRSVKGWVAYNAEAYGSNVSLNVEDDNAALAYAVAVAEETLGQKAGWDFSEAGFPRVGEMP